MPERTYWLDLFTGTTWQEFKDAGSTVNGFRESRWRTVQAMKVGDYLLCYLTGVSRFIAVLEVTKEGYKGTSPIWKDEVFPCRVETITVVELTPETAVPVHDLKDILSVFQNLSHPQAWTGHFRGSPARWKQTDGDAVLAALKVAKANPVKRPVDAKKLARRPRALKTATGASVTIPEPEVVVEPQSVPPTDEQVATDHTEVQALLLQLGADMGFDVWVARNDRSRMFKGKRLGDFPHMRNSLPSQFDAATNRTIELIDVLWLKGSAFIAAFEIESTTSIYSGLLRMSDLLAMQPNINLPLFLVAPDDRRDKVLQEVNRPTFARLKPPLSEVCRLITFGTLRRQVKTVASFVKFLKREFLDELSESCEVEEA